MEVIDNSTQLKESGNQSPEINYNFGIPHDVNFGVNSSARNKGETDINLLVACKVQLSSEVIRWKTEALHLQKGHELAQQKSKELDQVITKLSERTAELEDRLFQAENENKFLKTMSINVEEEKANLIQKLSQNLNKYHSYSWSELSSRLESTRLNRLEESELRNKQFSPQEDWREVSQKMLQQMKNEMKELQKMSFHFASDKEVPQDVSDNENADSKDEVEKDLSNLISETVSLKHILLDQRQKLKIILQSVTSGVFQETDKISHNKPALETLNTNEASKSISSTIKTKMTEEDYRLHFMKQLENACDIKKVTEKVQPFSTNPKAWAHAEPKQGIIHPNISNSQFRGDEARTSERKSEKSEKVCPICNIAFDASVSQIDFEEHVLNHLETESASLLDQYVVV
ncbi:zn-C2H2_12 domain-containing protein [Trichonephila clavipes]|nr:zn-C2H2_12 domain-containing protein [Trichonephila clavipes]